MSKNLHKVQDPEAMIFAGNVKSPVWIGKAGEIPNIVDEEWWCCLDLWKWFDAGMYMPKLEEDSMRLVCGLRVITEQGG